MRLIWGVKGQNNIVITERAGLTRNGVYSGGIRSVFSKDDGQSRVQMEVNVAVEEPRARIVGLRAGVSQFQCFRKGE